MSDAIIRQQGAGSVVADDIWEVRLGAGVFSLGLVAGAAAGGQSRTLGRLPVDMWPIGEEPDMRRLFDWVDGIMTDRPDVLARALDDRGALGAGPPVPAARPGSA